MKIIANPYHALPCELQEFTIDEITAKKDWFVTMEQHPCPDGCTGYDCHNMHAVPLDMDQVKKNLKNTPFKDISENDIKKGSTCSC